MKLTHNLSFKDNTLDQVEQRRLFDIISRTFFASKLGILFASEAVASLELKYNVRLIYVDYVPSFSVQKLCSR